MVSRHKKFAIEIVVSIILIILIVAIYKYLDKANTEIKNINGYKSNSYLTSAQSRVQKAFDITRYYVWTLIGAVVIFVVLLFIEIGFLFFHFFIFLVMISGFFIILYDGYQSAIAADEIKNANVVNNNGSYSSLVKVGVIGLLTIIIIISIIMYTSYKYNKRNKG